MENRHLTEIFERVYVTYYARQRYHISAEFHPYRSFRHTIRRDRRQITARVSQHFQDAPEKIIRILAIILFGKLFRQKVNADLRKAYRQYTYEIMSRRESPRTNTLVKYNPQGNLFHLGEIFSELNTRYFDGGLQEPHIGWSLRDSYHRLGFYDPVRDLLVISRIFDSVRVPKEVVSYLVYHEMLHMAVPARVRGGRRQLHSAEFRRRENEFAGLPRIRRWLSRNLRTL